ncbi:hypothetical protein GCM10009789_47040 [Kribbella sancticallisti]|uniref:DUF2231 domain-containing protein n=1 Tax=Kribbella sancticallisti TaxID=460087 RepID=A0ABN2DXG9_9ACTN
MESRAKVAGHSVHPVLIVYPLGLLSTAVVFDVLHLITDRPGFAVAAAYTMAAGLIGGVVAGAFGLVDWLAVPKGTRARRIGALHGLTNVVVLILFAISWLVRNGNDGWDPGWVAIILGFVGLLLSGGAGWLGGELVERLGVGVHKGANPDAPSSLSGWPATKTSEKGPRIE